MTEAEKYMDELQRQLRSLRNTFKFKEEDLLEAIWKQRAIVVKEREEASNV